LGFLGKHIYTGVIKTDLPPTQKTTNHKSANVPCCTKERYIYLKYDFGYQCQRIFNCI